MNIFTNSNKKFPVKCKQKKDSFFLRRQIVMILAVLIYFSLMYSAYSQNNVGIGCTNPDASALLELRSSSLGFLTPRMTQAQRPATPATGLLIYQTDNTPGFYYYDGTSWVLLLTGGNFWSLTGNAGTNPVNNYIGTSDAQDLVFRTNNTERMRILSGGNFGINTNNPTQTLEVANGNVLLSNTGTASQLRFAIPGGTIYTSFAAQAQTGNVNYLLPASDGTSGQALTTNGSGTLSWTTISGGSAGWTVGAGVVYNTTDNIGIGTNAPGQKLEISNGNILLSNTGTASELRFAEPAGTNYTGFKAQAQTVDVTYTLPAADGTSGQVLSTDGAGLLSWTTPSGSVPSGTSGQTLRYNTSNTLVATGFLTNNGSQVAVNDNNTSSQAAPFLIEQSGTGDASQRYSLLGGQSVSTGINNGDNDNYEISNNTTLASTGNYSDANKMLRIHTESGSIGIIDFNHQSRARAYLSSVTSVTSGTVTWTTVPFDTKNYDSQSEYNTGTYDFTALKDGYYQVNARTEFEITGSPSNGSVITIGIFVNGALYSQGNILQVAENFDNGFLLYNCAPVVCDVVPLTAGQTVSIRVYQDTGASQNIKSGTTKTYFSIHKMS